MINKFILLYIFMVPLLFADEFTVMTLNAQNLFDTKDDKFKDDKAYLPIEFKQSKKHINSCNNINVDVWRDECLNLDWDNATKNAKLHNLYKNIISFEDNGPDILALQEVENINILRQLFKLLEPYGYIDLTLVEGKDYRGIDTAIISKFKIIDSRLHYIKFSGKFEDKDTRPILDATILVNKKKLKIYNVHFPSGFNDVSMRFDSLNLLEDLLKSHNFPVIALGDFNVNTREDNEFNIYKSQENLWHVAHLIGCSECKGTYYYNYGQTWEYLDTIFVSKNRKINFLDQSINIHINAVNSYSDTGKPKRFNPKHKTGVSDHFAMVAGIKLN
ncbi:MAG: hypothetical protein CMD58_02980 [Gammaproteobacteria bacterium]|nr:hypothetical protein [Gammaproteobacteria bacterium]